MRSRYTAFALEIPEYIERSWHSSTCPKPLEADKGPMRPRWIRLQINRHEVIDSDNAVVEFVARYKMRGRVYALREISRFTRENGHWFYVDGTFPRG